MTQAKRNMVSASVANDVDLLNTMFEEHSGLLSKDVVVTSDVVAFVRRELRVGVSATRIGRILAKPPFSGLQKKLRAVDGGRPNVVIIRNHKKWDMATHKEIFAHINSDDADLDFEVDLLS